MYGMVKMVAPSPIQNISDTHRDVVGRVTSLDRFGANPGTFFQILLRRSAVTNASCDREFGTWVLFFGAFGGRFWYPGEYWR